MTDIALRPTWEEFFAGEAITPAAWPRLRSRLAATVLDETFGRAPPRPNAVCVEIDGPIADAHGPRHGMLGFTAGGTDHRVALRYAAPPGTGPWPTLIDVGATYEFTDGPVEDGFARSRAGHRWAESEAPRRGIALCSFRRIDLCDDVPEGPESGVIAACGPEWSWRTICCWAWGAGVCADALLAAGLADPERLAVTGHSRGGKAALCAGVLDERFGLVAPNGSGQGGTGPIRDLPPDAETLDRLTGRFPHWFPAGYAAWAGREAEAPFDAHLAEAAIAPRHLFDTGSEDDRWANPEGTRAVLAAAREIYAALGVPERIDDHWRRGPHGHWEEDWRVLLDRMGEVFGLSGA